MVDETNSMKHGFMRVWLAEKPYVLLFSPEKAEPILSSSKHIEKSFEYDFMVPWIGRGLLTSKGKKWVSRRKLLTPTFHFKILQDYTSVMAEKCRIFTECLEEASVQCPGGCHGQADHVKK
jgi:cytochrome P450